MIRVMAVVTLLLSGAMAQAETVRRVGNWTVSVEPDRFGRTVGGIGPADNFIAMREQNGQTLAVRCISSRLTMALIDAMPDRYAGKEDVAVQFRAGRKEIVRLSGTALDGRMIEVAVRDGVIADLMGADEAAFRITTAAGVQFDRVFTLRGTRKALAGLDVGCVIE